MVNHIQTFKKIWLTCTFILLRLSSLPSHPVPGQFRKTSFLNLSDRESNPELSSCYFLATSPSRSSARLFIWVDVAIFFRHDNGISFSSSTLGRVYSLSWELSQYRYHYADRIIIIVFYAIISRKLYLLSIDQFYCKLYYTSRLIFSKAHPLS